MRLRRRYGRAKLPTLSATMPDGKQFTRTTGHPYTHVVVARTEDGWSPLQWTTQPAKALAGKRRVRHLYRPRDGATVDVLDMKVVPVDNAPVPKKSEPKATPTLGADVDVIGDKMIADARAYADKRYIKGSAAYNSEVRHQLNFVLDASGRHLAYGRVLNRVEVEYVRRKAGEE